MFLTLHAGSSRRDDRGRGALAAESVEVGCVGPAVPRLAAHGLRLLMDSPHHHVGAACRGSGKGEGSGREERGVREKREQRGAPVVAESPTANALPCANAARSSASASRPVASLGRIAARRVPEYAVPGRGCCGPCMPLGNSYSTWRGRVVDASRRCLATRAPDWSRAAPRSRRSPGGRRSRTRRSRGSASLRSAAAPAAGRAGRTCAAAQRR